MIMIVLVTFICQCLSLTLHYLFGPFLLWSIIALGEFKEEHNVAGYTESIACSQILVFIMTRFLLIKFSGLDKKTYITH